MFKSIFFFFFSGVIMVNAQNIYAPVDAGMFIDTVFVENSIIDILPDSSAIIPTVKNKVVKKLIVPFSLIATGTLISGSGFEKSFQNDVNNAVGHDFYSGIDNYARYVPVAELYIADAIGIKAKNHWFDQTKNLTISILVTDLITTRLKRVTKKRRPNGSDELESFPSAHTSLAFTTATILYEEFIDTNWALAYSGYVFAITTGALRIMNNAHWVSDVLVGAGVGILVPKIVYLLDPIVKWNPFLQKKNVTVLPQIESRHYGVYFCMKF